MKGEGFTGDDLTIRYNARAEKDQAVALTVAATDVAFYRCKFSEYKDTLFTYCGKQFYKNYIVEGMINFIFGFAPVVFQDCLILVKLFDIVNVLTADDDSQIPARGIIIHRSVIKVVPRGLPILLRMCERIHLDLENFSWSENNTYFIIQLLHMSTHIIL